MKPLLMALTAMIIATASHSVGAQEPGISPKLAGEIATETYIWGHYFRSESTFPLMFGETRLRAHVGARHHSLRRAVL
jgi:hypothetical protein